VTLRVCDRLAVVRRVSVFVDVGVGGCHVCVLVCCVLERVGVG